MWEMLDAMVREGWVQEPSVLATGAGTTTGLTPLLLVKVQNQ